MRFFVKLTPAFLLFALLLLPAIARADTIVINSGALWVNGNSGPLFSFGNMPPQSFAVSNTQHPGDGGNVQRCQPCTGGQTISLNGYFAAESTLTSGPAVVGGISYNQLFYAGALQFTVGNVVVPSIEQSLLTITAPFTLSGFMEGYPTSQLNTPPIFSTMLSGQGLATLQLSGHFTPGLGYLYDFVSIRYDFSPNAPVPEPGPLSLLGAGLASLVSYARLRRKAKQ